MKKLIFLMVCIGLIGLWFAPNSMAATEAEKRAAIDAGLAYLATQQNGTTGAIGTGGTDYLISQTGASLLAFIEEKENWGSNAAAYQAVVDKGLNYLLSKVAVTNISTQIAGNPDSDGNGVGTYFYSGDHNRDTYITGLALPAIASSGTPNALVTVGPLASRTDGSGAGGAWTYRDVVQNTVDYFAFGQNDSGSARGGWRYYANYGSSDQSTTQWPIIAGLFASKMGVSFPAFVSSELGIWTNYIQYLGGTPGTGAYGTAGYDSPTSRNGEVNETGALLLEQAFLGWATGNPKVDAALGFINRNWQTTANSTWDGNFGHPYAMWAVYKGLELMIGLDDTAAITALHPQGSAQLDAGDIWNWWEDYCEYLVKNQAANGSWAGYSYWGPYLATPWYINILAATEIPETPIPEPATMLLLGSGLAGLGAISRRRRKK